MVHITPFITALSLCSALVSALPSLKRDSALGEEVAVSAPNGVILSDTAALASQSAMGAAATASIPPPMVTDVGSSYGSGYGSGSSGAQMGDSASSSWAQVTSTATAVSSYSTPSYGSGNSNWGNSQYNDCVQQCMANFGSPPSSYTPTATNSGSYGTGATHTVIVAPSQGVLRYIPFAVNASVGDTIKFMWGANNHTVTKSSALLPCNKTSDAPFISGTQNKGFVFTQVVNDTNPTYFYCGTPGHCQKGMFGIINPATNFVAPSSVSGQMQSIAANNSDVSAYAAYTLKQTANNTVASKWGGNIDISSLPDWSHGYVAENVLYTRNFLASNPEVVKKDGSIDLSGADSTPLMIPLDLSAALENAPSSPSASTVAAPAASSASASGSAASTSTASTSAGASSAAISVASPRLFVAAVVALATVFLL